MVDILIDYNLEFFSVSQEFLRDKNLTRNKESGRCQGGVSILHEVLSEMLAVKDCEMIGRFDAISNIKRANLSTI